MKKIIIMLIVNCVLSAQSKVQHPDHTTKDNWVELQDESHEIWIGYKETADITWCRTISILPFEVNKISNMIEDKGNYYNIFDRVTESKEVGDDMVYIRIDMPFPVSDRDYLVRYTIKKNSASASYKFQSVKEYDFPVFSSTIRLENAAGEWYLERINDSSTKVVYTWNGELGGSFPSYALTRAWNTQGNEMIAWLRESLEEIYKD